MYTLHGEVAERRRRTYRLLTGIILATLPCYACGIVILVAFGPEASATATPTLTPTPTETTTPTGEATATLTPGGPTVTLPATATQFVAPTLVPSFTPIPDTAEPTATPTPSQTPTKTGTPSPTVDETGTAAAPLTATAEVDPDGDGLTSLEEFVYGTDPENPDTDEDGLNDGDEVVVHTTNPNKADSDDGGEDDGSEVDNGRDPLDPTDDVVP